MYILKKALDEKKCDYTIEDDSIILNDEDYVAEKLLDTLKREFFILLEKEKEEAVAAISIEEKIEEYIRKMYLYETFSVGEICDKFEIKRGLLDKLFVKKYNMTAKEYLKRIRVSKGKEMLEEGYKVNMVSSLCGFGSVKTMQRAFKEVYNMTPSQCVGHLTEKSDNDII